MDRSPVRLSGAVAGAEKIITGLSNVMTLNLTDPTLAPLIARYRAWVEAENKKRAMQYAAYQSRDQQQYEEELAKYKALEVIA